MSVSIEELREKLVEQAKKKAEEIIREAEKKAGEITAAAEAEWLEKSRKEKERIINEAKTKARIIISEARRKARIKLTGAKNTVINEVYDEAWNRISNRQGFDVYLSLKNLLKEALSYVDEPDTVLVPGRDHDIISRVLKDEGLELKIQATDITGGILLIDKYGNIVDNSYDTRFKRSKEVLLPIISRILWG